jgi:solute carrier family 25 phosphate transporter 3
MMHRLTVLAKQAGVKGLFAGLGPRMSEYKCPIIFVVVLHVLPAVWELANGPVMTAGLVSSQFIMYGYIKKALNAPPGIEIHKDQ